MSAPEVLEPSFDRSKARFPAIIRAAISARMRIEFRVVRDDFFVSKHSYQKRPDAAFRMAAVARRFPGSAGNGAGLSRTPLERVAAGQRPATVRLSRPGRVVFGRRDVVPRICGCRRRRQGGRVPGMERLSGGRAAAFTEGALSLTFTLPDPKPAERTVQRFTEWSGLVRDAFIDPASIPGSVRCRT